MNARSRKDGIKGIVGNCLPHVALAVGVMPLVSSTVGQNPGGETHKRHHHVGV